MASVDESTQKKYLRKTIDSVRSSKSMAGRGVKIAQIFESCKTPETKELLKDLLAEDYQYIKAFENDPRSNESLEDLLKRRFPNREKIKSFNYASDKADILATYFIMHECALELNSNLVVNEGNKLTFYRTGK